MMIIKLVTKEEVKIAISRAIKKYYDVLMRLAKR